MRVKVAKWGNSVAVRLPKAAAEALRAVPGTELELTVENGRAQLSSPSRVRRIDIEELAAEARRLGPQNEPALEDWSALEPPWPDDDWTGMAPAGIELGKTKEERRGRKRS